MPRRGVELSLALGWKGQALFPKGTYTVDEIEHSGTPNRLTQRAQRGLPSDAEHEAREVVAPDQRRRGGERDCRAPQAQKGDGRRGKNGARSYRPDQRVRRQFLDAPGETVWRGGLHQERQSAFYPAGAGENGER